MLILRAAVMTDESVYVKGLALCPGRHGNRTHVSPRFIPSTMSGVGSYALSAW